MSHLKSLVNLRVISSLLALLSPALSAARGDSFKVELIPTIVWQGQSINSGTVDEIAEFRRLNPNLKLLHAVNPRMLMNGSAEVRRIQQSFGSILGDGDGIAMHVSRLREWMVFARIAPTSGENLYGIVSDSCDELCGSDQSLIGIAPRDLSSMIATGMSEMNRAGFGKPKIVIVEQGLLPDALWSALSDAGFKDDWSGFNLQSVSDRLRNFPVYAMNESVRTSIGGLRGDAARAQGRSLDHMRFGMWLEGADLTKIDATTDAVIQMASTSGRTIKFPLLMNAATFIHYSALLKTSVAKISEKIASARGAVVAWSGDDNSGWDPIRLRASASKLPVATVQQEQSTPSTPEVRTPVLVTEPSKKSEHDVSSADPSSVAAKPATDDAPPTLDNQEAEDPQIVPSHAREMSH